jgi:hypothetical protein
MVNREASVVLAKATKTPPGELGIGAWAFLLFWSLGLQFPAFFEKEKARKFQF